MLACLNVVLLCGVTLNLFGSRNLLLVRMVILVMTRIVSAPIFFDHLHSMDLDGAEKHTSLLSTRDRD